MYVCSQLTTVDHETLYNLKLYATDCSWYPNIVQSCAVCTKVSYLYVVSHWIYWAVTHHCTWSTRATRSSFAGAGCRTAAYAFFLLTKCLLYASKEFNISSVIAAEKNVCRFLLCNKAIFVVPAKTSLVPTITSHSYLHSWFLSVFSCFGWGVGLRKFHWLKLLKYIVNISLVLTCT